MRSGRKKILAISSGGGHWVQLLRLRPAFSGHDVIYVTVSNGYRDDVEGCRFATVPDATRWNPLGVARLGLRVAWLLVRERPDVVITTGAAPGYFALRIGRALGARTVWLDSIANTEQISLSGQKVGRSADLWLTQWPHLARDTGPSFRGSVL